MYYLSVQPRVCSSFWTSQLALPSIGPFATAARRAPSASSVANYITGQPVPPAAGPGCCIARRHKLPIEFALSGHKVIGRQEMSPFWSRAELEF